VIESMSTIILVEEAHKRGWKSKVNCSVRQLSVAPRCLTVCIHTDPASAAESNPALCTSAGQHDRANHHSQLAL
jgi:hypothetical protein